MCRSAGLKGGRGVVQTFLSAEGPARQRASRDTTHLSQERANTNRERSTNRAPTSGMQRETTEHQRRTGHRIQQKVVATDANQATQANTTIPLHARATTHTRQPCSLASCLVSLASHEASAAPPRLVVQATDPGPPRASPSPG